MVRSGKVLAWGIAALSAATVAAQPPGGGRGGGRMPGPGANFVTLLEHPDVQKELKLTSEEKTAVPLLKDEIKKIDEAFAKDIEAMGPPDGDFRERMKTMGEKSAVKRKDVLKLLTEGLGEEKSKRLVQIYYQMAGLMAIQMDPEIGKKLAITDEQRTSMMEIQREAMTNSGVDFRAMQDMPDEEKTAARKKMAEARAEGEKQVMKDVLTDAQRKLIAELRGTLVDFKVDLGTGRGMGRGGQGGGAGKGGGGKGKGGDKGGKEPPPPF